MIAPCSCVGTNQWVHESCLKTYCLQYLATHAANAPSLRVACPICRSDYQITARGTSSAGWRDLLRWSSTDRQLLLRHARFFFLVAPLVASWVLAFSWLGSYWEDLYRNGPGEPLMEASAATDYESGPQVMPFKTFLLWLPATWAHFVESLVGDAAAADWQGNTAPPSTPPPPPPHAPPMQHPAGISKNWSLLYVWLQYAQWYKVLCWLMVLVLGGSEGLLPSSVREAFQVEELLLANDTRAQVFILGQCVPFILTKARHFLVTWTGSSWLVRLVFYSLFTSHFEVAFTLLCDAVVALHLLYDWASSATNDYRLRLNLNRLRSGYFAIASLRAHPTATAHAHAE